MQFKNYKYGRTDTISRISLSDATYTSSLIHLLMNNLEGINGKIWVYRC